MEKSLLGEFLKRPIAYQPVTAKAFGSVKLGIFWSQLFYWSDKGHDKDGWIYKTSTDMYDETGLSRREQDHARKLGLSLGILEEKLAGCPATLHFRLNIERALELVAEFIGTQKQGPKKDLTIKPTNTIAYLKQIGKEDLVELAEKYFVTEAFVAKRAVDVIDYCEAKGKKYSNYKAALRNFIKMHLERHPQEAQAMRGEIRQKQIEEEAKLTAEKDKPRTPEEQARINAKLKSIRQNLTGKLKMGL